VLLLPISETCCLLPIIAITIVCVVAVEMPKAPWVWAWVHQKLVWVDLTVGVWVIKN
jgi:hypothetical protein